MAETFNSPQFLWGALFGAAFMVANYIAYMAESASQEEDSTVP